MLKESWKRFAVGTMLLGVWSPAVAESCEEEQPTPPVLILPSESDRIGREIELELYPDRWNGNRKTVRNASDTLSVSAVGRLGQRGRTFARWRHQDDADTVEAGLECSLFGRDHWKVSHQMQPAGDSDSDSTNLSLGLDVSQAAKLSLVRTSSTAFTEVGSGLSYKTETGFEWGAMVKARKLTVGDEGWLWDRPAIESNLRWTW